MHTFIIAKMPADSLGWTSYTLWSTESIDTLKCCYDDGVGIVDHFSEYHKWAKAIYDNPGAGRVILTVDSQTIDHQTGNPGDDICHVEITSDADWAVAVLSYPIA
jgi:hypothetical protein